MVKDPEKAQILLRVLHLEDNPLDQELTEEKLKFEGCNCEVVNVDNREDFVTRLENEHFDIILADYAMPGFDGLSALAIALKTKPDTPFILLSGTVGEELAIEFIEKRRHRLCTQESPGPPGTGRSPGA